MDKLKETIIEIINRSQAKHPVELFQELMVALYVKGYADGKDGIDPKEGYGE